LDGVREVVDDVMAEWGLAHPAETAGAEQDMLARPCRTCPNSRAVSAAAIRTKFSAMRVSSNGQRHPVGNLSAKLTAIDIFTSAHLRYQLTSLATQLY